MAAFSSLLDILAEVSDPRRAEGKLYKLPRVLLFSILAIISGCNSYRGIVAFIDVHRRGLNRSFGLKWRRARSHTAIHYILQGLDPGAVEAAFRRHAALLQAARTKPAWPAVLRSTARPCAAVFDRFHDRTAAHVLRAFATDTKLVLAHVEIGEKSSEIPAVQAPLAELGIAKDTLVTLYALHCQKSLQRRPSGQHQPHRPGQGQSTDAEAGDPPYRHIERPIRHTTSSGPATEAAIVTKPAPSPSSIPPARSPAPTGIPMSPPSFRSSAQSPPAIPKPACSS
jgi:predicted transposase YbfD/YdcC